MKSLIRLPFLCLFGLLRVLFVGFLSALFCVYTVDYLLNSSYGTFNLVLISVYFSSICVFCVVTAETFWFLQRKSKKKIAMKKEREKYSLK